MKRLTARDGDGNAIAAYGTEDAADFFMDVLSKLADYEDAEEKGLLQIAPCKPGDILYCIRQFVPTSYRSFAEERTLQTDNSVIPARVVSVRTVGKRKLVKIALRGVCSVITKYMDGERITGEDYEYCSWNMAFSCVGDTAFFDRKSAEKAAEKWNK